MEPISSTALSTSEVAGRHNQTAADLGSGDFFKLLITQILNQDPLQPTSNEDLLKQIASIREIELSSTLTDSLQRLTSQQHVGTASSMIGQYVTSLPKADGSTDRGLVVAIRMADGGAPVLQLSSGAELPLDQVGLIQPPRQAAESYIGQTVLGVDQRDKTSPHVVDAMATGVRTDATGEVLLELDNGSDIRLRDVLNVGDLQAVTT